MEIRIIITSYFDIICLMKPVGDLKNNNFDLNENFELTVFESTVFDMYLLNMYLFNFFFFGFSRPVFLWERAISVLPCNFSLSNVRMALKYLHVNDPGTPVPLSSRPLPRGYPPGPPGSSKGRTLMTSPASKLSSSVSSPPYGWVPCT